MPAMPKLTALERERFCIEYVKDLNITQAAARASVGKRTAIDWMKEEAITERIAELCAERNAVVKVDAVTVLREMLAIATVDPNEIMQVRRGCCRHCYGTEHRYQYTNQRALNKARDLWQFDDAGLVDEFVHGGVGFDPKKAPHLECPECGGEGGAYVHVNDTRLLSPAARSLFAGAKQTKDGIEVKLHDKSKHIELLARHLGMLNDKLEITGDLAERILAGRKRARGA